MNPIQRTNEIPAPREVEVEHRISPIVLEIVLLVICGLGILHQFLYGTRSR